MIELTDEEVKRIIELIKEVTEIVYNKTVVKKINNKN